MVFDGYVVWYIIEIVIFDDLLIVVFVYVNFCGVQFFGYGINLVGFFDVEFFDVFYYGVICCKGCNNG